MLIGASARRMADNGMFPAKPISDLYREEKNMFITYLALLLFSMNFMLCGRYILLVAFVGLCIHKGKIRIDAKCCVLAAFSLIYSIVVFVTSGAAHIDVMILPFAYLFGMNLSMGCEDKNKFVSNIFVCLAIGMCFHVFLNCASEIVQNGGFDYGAVHYDFWSGSVSSSTGQMINYSFAAALLTFIVMKRGKYLSILLLIIPCLVYGAIVGSRATIIISVVSVIVGILILALNAKTKKARISLTLVIILLTIILLAIQYNVFGLSEIISNSYLFRRIDSSSPNSEGFFATERWQIKIEYLKNIIKYPWGGGNIRQAVGGIYAHDLLLDTLSEGGVFAFAMLMAYLVLWVKSTIKFVRGSNSLACRVLLIPYTVVAAIQMFLEPILEGAPIFMLSVVLLDGVVTNMNRMRQEDENSISV